MSYRVTGMSTLSKVVVAPSRLVKSWDPEGPAVVAP